MIQIANFEDRYYNSLLEFSKNVWEHKSEDYLRYRLYGIAQGEKKYTNILLLDGEKVVGCRLQIPTKIWIKGVEQEVLWSHDTFIDESYRGDWGADIILSSGYQNITWGFGLSKLAAKMLKKAKYTFLSPSHGYIGLNLWIVKYFLSRIGLKIINKEIEPPPSIKVDSVIFSLIDNVEELHIPNDGYWNMGQVKVDFVRDREFLNYRFFNNFNKYNFYRLASNNKVDSCYFVIRFTRYNNCDFVSLVDYRFDISKPQQFDTIITALGKIAQECGVPFYGFTTTLQRDFSSRIRLIFRRKGHSDVVTNDKRMNNSEFVCITAADSDSDFCNN